MSEKCHIRSRQVFVPNNISYEFIQFQANYVPIIIISILLGKKNHLIEIV